MRIAIPETCLVVLVGISGSGKSTFAARHFGPYEVLSSDFCRALVSGDATNQEVSSDAFDVLGYIAGKRLAGNRLTVVDATNVTAAARRQWIALAKDHDVLPVAIVLDVPPSLAKDRDAQRDRVVGPGVIDRQTADLRRGLKGLRKEGFRRVHLLTPDQVEAAEIVREPLLNDRRDLAGPFDVIGDVHGCLSELAALLARLGYDLVHDDRGRAVDAVPPAGRTAVFVGDLVDRGPDPVGVLRLVMGMVASGHALCVAGNHEAKLERALNGARVNPSHGLAETLRLLDAEPEDFRAQVRDFVGSLVAHYVLDGGRLVVAHAGLKEAYHGRASGRVRAFALYGDTTGESDEFGLPVRYPWANDYRGSAMVVYGHTPVPTLEWINNTLCLDTGCAFGGALSALRYPERETVQVAAEREYYPPVRPLRPPARDAAELRLADVAGVRYVETSLLGRIKVEADQAAGALEVMSRFALHPARLAYLPPTMSPVATSRHEGLLEHPDEAFSQYAEWGVDQVICESKHMGSRGVLKVAADGSGELWTRTGRPFFDAGLTARLSAEVATAVSVAGLWDRLGAEWVLFDTEVLPWSLKAQGLLEEQYRPVGAAAVDACSAAGDALAAAAARGLDVAGLARRTAARMANAEAFRGAVERYCWPTDGLDGVRIAPFQLLASSSGTYAQRDHLWHLAIADRLAEVSERFCRTDRLVVDLADAASRRAGTRWWEELTAAGAEGMVVKPLANLTRGRRGLVQPGLKVRGREYLRIIYGPDYTEPENLARLRERNLARKRALALREYALGLEALERLVAGQPLWRVHEAVFAILALESDPVDPRL